MHEAHQKKRKANLLLAAVLGAFVILLMIYSMRFIWPHVDIFAR